MTLATGNDPLAEQLLKVLGLDQHSVYSLDVRLRGGRLVEVHVVSYVRQEQVQDFTQALTRYKLVPLDDAAQPQPDASGNVQGEARPWYLTRWWLRNRPAPDLVFSVAAGAMSVNDARELQHAAQELYVPWWAWPLEGLHRLVFGTTRLEPLAQASE